MLLSVRLLARLNKRPFSALNVSSTECLWIAGALHRLRKLRNQETISTAEMAGTKERPEKEQNKT